jgi:hypothetical protein
MLPIRRPGYFKHPYRLLKPLLSSTTTSRDECSVKLLNDKI